MDNFIKQKWIIALLAILLVGDLGYSFLQHYHHPIDGDLAPVVVPAEFYSQMLNDPFGMKVLKEGKSYAGTNRYFAHISMLKFYRIVPNFLQTFIEPIKSVYLSSALVKIVIQFLLLLVLTAYVLPKEKLFSINSLIVATLIYPLFQTEGYNAFMGIVDHSVSYAFFYALPLLGLLIFFLPYYKKYLYNKAFKVWWLLPLFLLSIYLAFHGAIITPIVIIIVGFMILALLINSFKQSTNSNVNSKLLNSVKSLPYLHLILPTFFMIICLYSFYIGTFNLEGKNVEKPLSERYIIMLKALPFYFTNKLGLPLLFLSIGINCFLMIRLSKNNLSRKLLQFFAWLAVFSLIYLLLLPLGGYREYRPSIIRYDTFMPITLILIYVFATSTYFLFNHLKEKSKWVHIAFIALVLVIFTISDQPKFDRKDCEHHALIKIANSTEKVLRLEENCGVMSWFALTYPEGSDINVKMLKHWNIVDKDKQIQYYH